MENGLSWIYAIGEKELQENKLFKELKTNM
jgi:hypothetical protein